MVNYQRRGSKSNTRIGRDFEDKIMQYFYEQGLDLDFYIKVPVGIKYKKG